MDGRIIFRVSPESQAASHGPVLPPGGCLVLLLLAGAPGLRRLMLCTLTGVCERVYSHHLAVTHSPVRDKKNDASASRTIFNFLSKFDSLFSIFSHE